MKVHPATPKKRSITTTSPNPKKLKRLPHIFGKVLELPFHSEADVLVQETPDSFCFVASSDDISVTDDFRTHVIEILPGVTKILIRKIDGDDDDDGDNSLLDELEIDKWRFRLPAMTRPEMASARCIGGQLVVTVPKAVNHFEDAIGNVDDDDNWDDGNGKYESILLVG